MILRQIEWPDAPPKGDAADFIGPDDELKKLVLLAPAYKRGEQNEKHQNRNGHGTQTGFRLITLGQLRAEPAEVQNWLVDGLLVRGGTSLMVSKPKVGKTTTTRGLALAVARGNPFLGRAATQGLVVLLALQERRAKVRQHFEQMGAGEEVDTRILIHCGAAPADAVDALHKAIEEHHPDLVIVDMLGGLVRARDFNDYAQVSQALEPIIELARQTGTHICLTHHLGKGERSDDGDGVLGSTAILGAVDTAILLKRRSDGTRTIRTIQRDGDDLEETVLSYDKATGLLSLGGSIAEEQIQAAKRAVLDALTSGEELTEPDIRERAGGNHGRTSAALRALVEGKLVERVGEGKRGDPYRYKLAQRGEQD